ncbi:MAG TPA: bifunctional serine/threonine-protein kinase/formylglycine-generating enzyme family protein [Pirellulales bacterium]
MPPASTANSAQSAPSNASRFEVLRPHASGGLGQVSVAVDKELHRQVALKEIHPRLADQPESRARFLLEAEVTGGLEHPGVVPVYGLGQWPDGRLYYAMRLIRGESLEEAVRRYHDESSDDDQHELELRKLLRRFIDVCDAIGYAHSRGVLHRDLKPSNIMLGPYGETLVVDWGLAKTASQSAESGGCAQSVFAPPAAGDTPATRIGSALGTPAYMSPEQAVGAIDLHGPASDVYSLGATLYTILTGRPPFIGDDFLIVRGLVIMGIFPPPREVRPDVPRTLEAICQKAMALDAGDRYATARALAEDIEKWLGDAPVSAYREGCVERGTRWLRKHRTLALAAGATLLLTTIVASAATLLVNRARVQTKQARQQRLLTQVELLSNAEAPAIGMILDDLRPFHAEIAPRLRAKLARDDLAPHERMRLNLALIDDDPSLLPELVESLLTCADGDFAVLRDRLRPHVAQFEDRLWRTLHDGKAAAAARSRAGLALAAYAPESANWTPDDAAFLAHAMLTHGLERQHALRAALAAIAPRLLGDVHRLFCDVSQPGEVRAAATAALADWAVSHPQLLATAVSNAGAEQFLDLWPALLAADRNAVLNHLRQIVNLQPKPNGMTEAERVSLGRRRAAAAIALMRLNNESILPLLLTPADDPEGQTQFVAGVRQRGVPLSQLLAHWTMAGEERVRVALLLSLGEYPLEEIDEPLRTEVVGRLDTCYRTDCSSAIHAASGWLLRTWRRADGVQRFDATPRAADYDPARQWFVLQVAQPARPCLSIGMVNFPAGEFLMGSPATERDRQVQESQHRVKLTRPFALADRPVCRALYVRFLQDTRGADAVEQWLAQVNLTAPTEKHPAVGLTWYDAVLFCRWLTAQCGMSESDQCYADPATLKLDAHGYPADRQWPFRPDRRGFRLPTEAEWEYACRAGTVTAFSFGSDLTVANAYGWFQGNSDGNLHPTMPLKPTGRGLVSMHGNGAEWCHDWLGFIPGGAGIDPVGVANANCRAVRSGSFLSGAALARSASRAGLPPEFAPPYAGLRLTQTLP